MSSLEPNFSLNILKNVPQLSVDGEYESFSISNNGDLPLENFQPYFSISEQYGCGNNLFNKTFQDTNSFSSDNNAINRNERNLFITKINKKRGRIVEKNSLEKEHGKYDFDNVLTKIQVHFINFLINLANDAINTQFNSKYYITHKFKQINYKEKKNIRHNYIMDCFKKPIKDIIQLDITTKYKNFNSKYNKELYAQLTAQSEWLKDFLDLKFIDVFYEYYYNLGKELESFNFKDKKVNISKSTKSFRYLLEKEEYLVQEIISIVKDVYLSKADKEKNNGNLFNINKEKN
jgi:hypothetical protein